MTIFKKTQAALDAPKVRELTLTDLKAVSGGRAMLNPQPLPPYSPGR